MRNFQSIWGGSACSSVRAFNIFRQILIRPAPSRAQPATAPAEALPFVLELPRSHQPHEAAPSFPPSFAAGIYPIGWPSTNSSSKAPSPTRMQTVISSGALDPLGGSPSAIAGRTLWMNCRSRCLPPPRVHHIACAPGLEVSADFRRRLPPQHHRLQRRIGPGGGFHWYG